MEEIEIGIEASTSKDGLCEAVFCVDGEKYMGPTMSCYKAESRTELAKQVAEHVYKVLSGIV